MTYNVFGGTLNLAQFNSVILRLIGSGQRSHRHVVRKNATYRLRLGENVTKEFPHHVVARIHDVARTIRLVVGDAKDTKSGRNVKGVDVRLVVVGDRARTEKTFEIDHEIKVERKFAVVHVETQRGVTARRIDILLRSVGETVGLVLLQHASHRKRLQTRHADVMTVLAMIHDESHQILHPHVVTAVLRI